MTTGSEVNTPNHQGGPQGWVRWIKTRSIILKSFSSMIFKIGPFSRWKQKVPAQLGLWVYNSKNYFLGFLYIYHNTCCVKPVNGFLENKNFWDTLMRLPSSHWRSWAGLTVAFVLHNIHDRQCCIISMICNAACVDWCCGQTPCHGISMNSEQWTATSSSSRIR